MGAIPGSAVVVDASVMVKWVVREAGSDRAALLLDGRTLHAPDLVFVEVANALWAMRRRGVLPEEAPAEVLAWLLRAPLVIAESARVLERALALATVLEHPVYDCVYLSLAAELAAPVVTADARLLAAAARDRDAARLVLPLERIGTE
jgi:predicted nucleic acid-binding protein